MRNSIIAFLFTLLFLDIQAQTPTPEQLIREYIQATGDSTVYDSVQNFTWSRRYRANAPTDFDEEVVVSLQEAAISRKKTLMQRDFFYVVNKSAGWLKIPTGSRDKIPTYSVKDLSVKERTAMQLEVSDGLWAFIDYKTKGYTAQVMGNVLIGTTSTWHLVLTKAGVNRSYFFDATTHLLVREIEETTDETVTWDFTSFAKTTTRLLYPNGGTRTSSRDKRVVPVTTTLLLNTPIPASLFVR